MDYSKYEQLIAQTAALPLDGKKTQIGEYVIITEERLDSATNRLNSSWIRAQFMILKEVRNPNQLIPIVKKWKGLPVFSNQFLIIQTSDNEWHMFNPKGEELVGEKTIKKLLGIKKKEKEYEAATSTHANLLRAMRTKPFLLLAGISGTGKSRIVKELAYDSCPKLPALREDPTSPGNYCLVEVKPNWHDSTELLGYESKINGNEYVVTPFIRFLVKAMQYPDTPFFMCLDEMNLAPVEQYFAEFLSVLESRKRIGDTITSEPLIKASVFATHEGILKAELFGIKPAPKSYNKNTTVDEPAHYGKLNEIYDTLKKDGLRIPPNLIVVGTVNMDETTHQFSRKVIDRAMTIEMNLPAGNPFMDFYDSAQPDYGDIPFSSDNYLPSKVTAAEALDELEKVDSEKTEWLKKEIANLLTTLNNQLECTPFKIAYRVQNELIIYFFEAWQEKQDTDWERLLTDSMDQILMMKVLPRIEGDDTLLKKPLEKLMEFCSNYPNSHKKINEMNERLDRAQFTSFWP